MKSRIQTQINITILAAARLSPQDDLVRALLADMPPSINKALRAYIKESKE